MEANQKGNIVGFLKQRGFDDKTISEMFRKCKRLDNASEERAISNWNYLISTGIPTRKLPSIVSKCPKILVLGLYEKLEPMVECLKTLATKPNDVASAIAKFPHILSHSIEEKLCPLLAFFQGLGVPEKELGRLILLNPRLISYSIESKLCPIVSFFSSLGFKREGEIGKIFVKNPYVMGYSVEKRLRPTSEFLREIGLNEENLQRVAVNYPDVLCRDVKVLIPNLEFLKGCGLGVREIVVLIAGFPPVLIKSVKNSLDPRIRFLVDVMGRRLEEVAEFPEFFKHGLKKRIEFRYRLVREKSSGCSLSELFGCNQKKFALKFGLLQSIKEPRERAEKAVFTI
ncbi:hypothetical protein AMTRI_Chr03g137900 [Amborella trichopoda]|uniref:Uncharacterized protein n=1 Tax=Amborella trichopoda TaxID=13333 RepID=W1PVV7_AMBTC|nr:transcription termination factor MTERF6, chloroplastic/mitochondrial [Amborella trichopoda]ERN11430.1 hypothetical protein AMTR_s00022p00050580 [Amborella trichopoda]|eukprot:XP_006849849.1 transcription termination factor MTERF6, chloroplastic/mitochondrial [Amborella trichopoda]